MIKYIFIFVGALVILAFLEILSFTDKTIEEGCINNFCIGHGEGTWDLITGKFS